MRKFSLIFVGFLFAASLSACATTSSYYTRVSKVSLIERGVSVGSRSVTLYLTVANPTDERRHFVLRCCIPLSPNDCLGDIVLVVPPRSDKHETIRSVGSLTCRLIPNRAVHE